MENMVLEEHSSGSRQGTSLRERSPYRFTQSLDIIHPEASGYSLFGDTGADFYHVYQGLIGNCWFMHGASAVAKKRGRLEQCFLNDGLSTNGVYGINFYILGVKTTVVIDDIIPVDNRG